MNLDKELILKYTSNLQAMLKHYDEFYVALTIYEFLDLSLEKISDELIDKVYSIIDARDTVFDEDMREEIRDLESDHEREEEYEKD